MKGVFLYSLLVLGTINCDNVEDRKSDVVSPIKNNDQRIVPRLTSGKYGNVSIAVSGDTVTGVYEYYDKWNATAKQFTDINVFYFYGHLGKNQFQVKAGWPGDDLITGTITYGTGIKIKLEDQPDGYAAVDFVGTGYQAASTAVKNWIRIGIIKSEKAYLYKSPEGEKTKVYMVKEDVVKIVERAQGWYRVEYNPPANSGKIFTGWIKNDDLYDLDPVKW